MINKNYIFIIIPLLLFMSKWALSFIIYPSDLLITKVLFHTLDSQYYPIVKNLANFDFSPTYNENITSDKLLTFPYGPFILHSIFYKIFGNSSFILIEYVFIFLFFITIYKIFKHIGFSFNSSVFCSLILLFLPTLVNLFSNFDIPYIFHIRTTFETIYSTRFPRPQVTGLYYLVFVYLALKFSENINENTNKKYAVFFAIILGLILNSFFYFFIYCCLALLILFLVNFKKNFFLFIISKINIFLFFTILVLVASTPFFLQNYLGEPDHSLRIGLVKIDLEDRIYLNKFFFQSILRFEPLFIFCISLLLTIFIKNYFKKENLFKKIDIIFYLYISSIVTPFLFISISPKVIAIYHFATYILVNGILYIVISSLSIFYFYFKYRNKNKFFKKTKEIKITLTIIILFLFIFDNYFFLKRNSLLRTEFNEINEILSQNQIVNSKINLFTNDMRISNLWILSHNKNLVISDGFTSAITDEKIIKNLAIGLKLIGINRLEFKEILDFKGPHYSQRNPLIQHLFNYKYQANKFHQFSNDDQYTKDELKRIKTTSPLRVMANILPKDEKNKFLEVFDKTVIDKENYKDYMVILNTSLIPESIRNKNYIGFSTIYKKEKYLFLKKNN